MTADHNTPTIDQDQPVKDPISRNQLDQFAKNAAEFNMPIFYPLGHEKNGVVHIIGPENGFTQPGMTIVCGDSHTSTHGAFGTIAFGIGTSEVEMVLATQCILQSRPKTMRITYNGKLGEGVMAKDLALYTIAKLTTGGATGYFVEYAGEAIQNMTMEERRNVNYDHPFALDNDLFYEHLKRLMTGQAIEKPTYDFVQLTRAAQTEVIHPAKIIIIEGILVLEDARIRELADIKIFVEADDDLRFIRRLQRDIKERGRTIESVVSQYLQTVKPMHYAFVKPTKRYADIIIPNDYQHNVAVDLIHAKIISILNQVDMV